MTLSFRFIALFLLFSLAPLFVLAQADQTGSGDNPGGGSTTDTPTNVSGLAVQTPLNSSIYNCNKVGAQSVGATAAIGGTYVPVADAAVELNTGYLVQKECLLRPMIASERQALSVSLLNNDLELFSKGKNGNPLWVVNYGKESANARDQGFVQAFQGGVLSGLNSAFQNQVKTALVRNYQMTTQAPQNSLTCPYSGNLRTALAGDTTDLWGALGALTNPACSPYSAYTMSQDQLLAAAAASQQSWLNQLNWNNGIYSVTDGQGNVTTPGIFLSAIGQQAVTSGFRQLENANDLGQIVGSFFANFGSKLLSSAGGIPSVLASNGPDSYLSQAMQQQQSALLGNVSAVALQNLNQILNWEQQYADILTQEANLLTSTVNQLRGAESACWDLIKSHVCTAAATSTASGNTCTSSSGTTLTIATSTEFSDAAIAKLGVSSSAGSLKTAIDTANQNIVVINSLLAAVQSTDATARNTALANLNTIVSANPPVLATQDTITAEQANLQKLQDGLTGSSGFVTATLNAWAGNGVDQFGSPVNSALAWSGTLPPNGTDTGWCNINKQPTLDQWISIWSQ